ncbi:MAG: hypothetical protein RLZZ15_2515, partial [Verrucomicrobiota bacterium]
MPDSPNLDQTLPLRPPPPVMFARYRLRAELGRGGMGVVWRAEDTKLRRDVALKFLPELVVRDREAMADLAAETRRCLELTHPHIVRVYDLVEEGDRAAISMELVDGGSLAERKLAQPDRCFSTTALAPWVAQLCAALDYAHHKVRLVHRDLKPLNLLVNAAGDLKVVDFGIARSLLSGTVRRSMRDGAASISLGYAGPQQLMGEPASVADDIYSVGATLYELLTGKPPFYEGDIVTQLREVVPPTLAARRAALGVTAREPIPAAWEETIAACLAKNAADRPRGAAEIAARLGLALPGGAAFGEVANGGAAKPRANRRIALFGAAAALVIAVAGGAVFFWPREKADEKLAAPDRAKRGGGGVAAAASVVAPVPAPAPEVVVSVTPADAGARVWIANVSAREVPDDGRLALLGVPDGDHALTVQAAGYQAYHSPAPVKVAGGRGTAEVQLVPVFGVVQIVARPGTVVTAVNSRGRKKDLGPVPVGGTLRADRALTVGSYAFALEHADYAPARVEGVGVAKDRVARVAPAQVALPAELRVFSVPAGADVIVNGAKVGVTPATLPEQPAGKPLTVEVFLAGYRRDKRTLTLKPRVPQTIDVGGLVLEGGALELRAGAEIFAVPGATARIDGQVVAVKNGRAEGVEVGQRELEILHADYEPWKQTVAIADRKTTSVAVKLAPRPGELTLTVTGPAAYALAVNGQAVAVKNNRATLPATEALALEISAPGFKADRRTLTLPPRAKQTLAVALEKIDVAEPGRPWTIPGLGLALRPVAAGAFAMRTNDGDPNERATAQVIFAQVTLTKGFWLGRTEVTQREWVAVMGANPARFQGEERPVENVTWTEAAEFCRKLTERERAADRLPPGYVYALPTEAQWEWACRAGSGGRFWWGDDEAEFHLCANVGDKALKAMHPD